MRQITQRYMSILIPDADSPRLGKGVGPDKNIHTILIPVYIQNFDIYNHIYVVQV